MKKLSIERGRFEAGHNVTFVIHLQGSGFMGKFRIHYANNTRKNANYNDYRAIQVYFEGMEGTCTAVEGVTDTCLFVERKQQWILETLDRKMNSIVPQENGELSFTN